MMCNRINFVLKHFYKRPIWNCRLCSTIPQTNERDPAPFFFDRHVQELLTTLTRINYEKVFATRKDGAPLEVPQYAFMTDKELQEARALLATKAKRRIQMPPVVKIRSDEVEVLVKEPELEGYEQYNLVFTDISFGKNNRDRLIVIREPNGTLRQATCNERHRMNQIYFPINGRELHTPKMFFHPYLSDLLDQGEFEFILDRACLQFEPDDPEYHRVTKEVYSYVYELNKLDALRSTRHFGPLVFQLAWEKNINKLLLELIDTENIEEAGALVRLYYALHPDVKSAQETIHEDIELIKVYAELNSLERHAISNAIQRYNKMQKERKEVEKGIMKAHGLIDNEDV
ncbi:28S ribosomal protein S22, mitochondrial isoform X2 [Bombus affinis]|uniref:28S ribosomal protein S22, mitochondrial isoform X2 n=1 Tax=Bombus affinis TaxID=309941 RepID=UPI0021B8290E|nr:28S ribosomal protein S22, mitochondrial isoform X2 [Bombus affinis]